MAKRCAGIKKDGSRCARPPMRDSDYCVAHVDKETKGAIGFGGPQEGSGRRRRPREIELIQEVAEEFRGQLRAVYSEGLIATRSVVVGTGEAACVEEVPDHAHRLRVAQEIQDRLHGKPTSSVDVAGAVDVNLNLVTNSDLRERAADLRRRLADCRSVKPSRADAGD